MGLVHGQIQESNARTRLRLYERVANHVAWNPMQESNAGTRLCAQLRSSHAATIAFVHWIHGFDRVLSP